MKDFSKIIKYFRPFLMKYRWMFFGTVIFALIDDVLISSIAPLYFKKLIDIVGTTPIDGSFKSLIPILIILFVIQFIGYVSFQANRYLTSRLLGRTIRDLNQASYDAITNQDYHFFADNFVGSLTSKFSKFGRAFHMIFDTLVWQVLSTGLSLIIMLIILFRENLYLGIIFTLWTFIYGALSIYLVQKHSKLEEERSKKETKLSGFVSDVLANILNIKIFSSGKRERELFDEVNEEAFSAKLDAWKYSDRVTGITRGVQLLFQMLIIAAGVYFWSQGLVTTGIIVLLLLYINQVSLQLMYLGFSLRRFIEGISDSKEIIEIIEQDQQVKDPTEKQELKISKGTIRFDNIGFQYSEGEKVFDNFSLEIPHGQSLGVVGTSGSGKTTITKLLLRFFDVQSGSIVVDGQDIREVSQDDLRSKIAYIPQEPVLFHRNIYENISYAHPHATRDEVLTASRLAHADDFIKKLPEGYDTLVGERGVKLSGGQRQRVAIARAMLRSDAPILIMDEATSSLDSLSEEFIQESFETLTSNRTTIVIAHRLSTIKKMDRIIVLKNGEIVEDGNHDTLLEKGGEYSRLWNAQVNRQKQKQK